MEQEPNPPYPFSTPIPHHRLAHTLAWLILAIALIALVAWIFFRPDSTIRPTDQTDELAMRRALLAAPNPPVELSAAEIASRQALLDSPNKPAQLSDAEIARRQALLGQLQ